MLLIYQTTEDNRVAQMLTNGVEEEDWNVREKYGEGRSRPYRVPYPGAWRREVALITEFLHCSWISGWNIQFWSFTDTFIAGNPLSSQLHCTLQTSVLVHVFNSTTFSAERTLQQNLAVSDMYCYENWGDTGSNGNWILDSVSAKWRNFQG